MEHGDRLEQEDEGELGGSTSEAWLLGADSIGTEKGKKKGKETKKKRKEKEKKGKRKEKKKKGK
jgi:hypothetical protein